MATNKKLKSKAKAPKISSGKSSKKKAKVVTPAVTFSGKVEALVSFSDIYNNLSRSFPTGSLVVLNNYHFLGGGKEAAYRLAIVLKAPSLRKRLFSNYPTYQIAFITEDGVIRTMDLSTDEIICRLEDAPISFTFA